MKPIIFSTEMVIAILEGRKTVTRRVVKIPSWTWDKYDDLQFDSAGNLVAMHRKHRYGMAIKQPYAVGDVLWVRETWNIANGRYSYKADWMDFDLSEAFGGRFGSLVPVWKPSIHMPRDVARLFLRVKSVRAERLQDISDSDAHAEGMDSPSYPIIQFKDLWNSLNDDRGYGWEVNPWVWVVDLEKIEAGGASG